MVDALARSLVSHRGRWTLALAAVALLAGCLASRLQFRHEAGDFLPRNQGAGALRLAPGSGHGDRLVIVLRAQGPVRNRQAGPILDSLAQRLAALPGVGPVSHRLDRSVVAYFDGTVTRHLLLVLPDSALVPLVERGDAGPAVRAAQRFMARAVDLPGVAIDGGYFTSVDRRTWLVLVEPAMRLDDIGTARAFMAAMAPALQQARRDARQAGIPGATVTVLGRAAAYVAGTELALQDIRRVTLAAAAVVFGLLLLLFRRPTAPLLILLTTAFGLALTGAVAALVWGTVSLVAWFFIVALVGFGDEFAIYIITHYWFAARHRADRAAALASALARPGPGILLGALTSAAAFLSLVTVSYPVMWQLGILSALGLLLIVAASFTLLPLLLSWTAPGAGTLPAAMSPFGNHPSRVRRLTARRSPVAVQRATAVGFLMFVIVCAWLARGLHVETHPWRVVVRGLPETALLDSVRSQFGMSFAPVRIRSEGATLGAALERDRRAVEAIAAVRGKAGIAAIASLSRWIPAPDSQRANLAFLAAHRSRLPASLTWSPGARFRALDSIRVHRALPLLRRALDGPWEEITPETLRAAGLAQLLDRHVSRDGDRYVVTSEIFLTRLPWEPGVVRRFTTALGSLPPPALDSVLFMGDALRGATHGEVLRRDMLRATGLAIGLTLLLLWWRFRSVRQVALALVPLVVGVAAALATLGVLGLELNVLSLAIGPILVGIGSDDGIHIVDRLHGGEPMDVVLRETGAPMVITTITTIAAFACLAVARFPGVREVGIVASVGLTASLLAALWLVPGLHSRP